MRWHQSLTARLVLLASAQGVLLIIAAICIAVLTRGGPREDRPPEHHPGPGHHARPPHINPGPRKHDRPVGGPELTLFVIFVCLLVGAYLTARWLVPPLKALQRAARQISAGDFSARVSLPRGDEIGELALTFNEMAERIESMLQAERVLLANVSHELRTPLARLRVALELIEDGDPELARLAVEDMTVDMMEMESLLDDIFTAARLETAMATAGVLVAQSLELLSPSQLARRAIERFGQRYPDRPVRFEVAAPPEVKVMAHEVLMRRALENLLENAHKYSPSLDSLIEVRVEGRGDDVCFSVVDHGEGIPLSQQERLFEPFYRAPGERSARQQGLGLGLDLVRRIVVAHEGRVELVSAVGEGTTVALYLPKVMV